MTKRRNFWVRSIGPVEGRVAEGWAVTPLVRDYPGVMGRLTVYASTLEPGVVPHEIHHHPEEEIELLLRGELELITPDGTVRLGPGSFHFQPSGAPHTIRSVGTEPALFLVMKWLAADAGESGELSGRVVVDGSGLGPWEARPGIQRQQLAGPLTLANGTQLFVYAAHWPEQTGYRVHTDPFDVLIALAEGRLAGFGHDSKAPAAIYYPVGAAHGVRPVDDGPSLAFYFQFYPPEPRGGAESEVANGG